MTRLPVAVLLTGLFVLVNALFGPAAIAAQPLGPEPQLLRLDIATMNPRVVTSGSETLTVTAELTNVSDAPILNLRGRLQLGAPQQSEAEVRQALSATAPTDSQRTPFRLLTPRLAPGQSTDLTIVADLRGAPEGLVFAEPGVYPMLININGQPQNAAEARLAAMNLMLPVLSSPDGEPVKPTTPTAVSTLWPIAAKPRVVSAPLDGRLVLSDDGLAEEMQPGGRLNALVSAAEAARESAPVFSSLCFAIDPELVATADAMTRGYRVKDGTGSVWGDGRQYAKAWLGKLRTLVKDRCVVAMPYAGAEVSALARTSPELAKAAVAQDDLLRETLDVEPNAEALWPAGELTDGAMTAMAAAGKRVLIGNPKNPASGRPIDRPTSLITGDGATSQQRAVPFDPVLSLALAPGSASREVGHNATVAADDSAIATQNGIAALAFHAGFSESPGRRPLMIVPPRLWDASAGELSWMLDQVEALRTARLVEPKPLSGLLEAPTDGTVQPVTSGSLSPLLPPDVAGNLVRADDTITDLTKAMAVDPVQQVEPAELIAPLREGLIRVASTSWRNNRVGVRKAMVNAEDQLATVLGAVKITKPGRTISLASGSSPIPVSINNSLPVEIKVRVELSHTIGLRPAEVSDLAVPASSSRNLRIPTEALRAGRFNVDVSIRTPGGTGLGTPTRFELASTEYGAITVIVTATAAGALLLLSGRRIYRRLRSNGTSNG